MLWHRNVGTDAVDQHQGWFICKSNKIKYIYFLDQFQRSFRAGCPSILRYFYGVRGGLLHVHVRQSGRYAIPKGHQPYAFGHSDW